MENTIVFSASTLSRLPACQRAWALTFIARLRSKRIESKFTVTLGRAFHAALASYYKHYSIPDALRESEKVIFNDSLSMPFLDKIEIKLRMEDYVQQYVHLSRDEDDILQLQPIETEYKFAFPLPYKDSLSYCVGFIDLYADTKYGPAIVEHKTSASCGPSHFMDSEFDVQSNLYVLAAEHERQEVNSFIWNVFVKTKTPTLRRYATIPSRQRAQRYAQELAVFGHYLKTLNIPFAQESEKPAQVEEIIEKTAANPGACRTCIFRDLCDAPVLIPASLENFKITDYSLWEEKLGG